MVYVYNNVNYKNKKRRMGVEILGPLSKYEYRE